MSNNSTASSNPSGQATTSDDNKGSNKLQQQPTKPAAQLEEDDEFEDFPVEDWAREEEVGAQAANTHLWEESWDDDDVGDDFSVQLK